MRRLPASSSRAQAVKEIEPVLLDAFQRCSRTISADTRDAMHYGLFSVNDRFCASAAWLIAPRLGISRERWAPVGAGLELLRCAIELKTRRIAAEPPEQKRFVEPTYAEAAAFGLIPMAFELLLEDSPGPTPAERLAIAATSAALIAPMSTLTAAHREARLAHDIHGLSLASLKESHLERVSPVFEAAGAALETLAPAACPKGVLRDWLRKLGLFAHWLEELEAARPSPLSLNAAMTMSEAIDLIKSLEVELLAVAANHGFREAAHELLEPLAGVLSTRLQ